MFAASGPLGLLPVLSLGLLLAVLVAFATRRLRARRAAVAGGADGLAFAGRDGEPNAQRRRILTSAELAITADVEDSDPDEAAAEVEAEPPLPPTGELSESITAVLRRRVPPCSGGAVSSWLGGLPEMPEQAEWPRSISSERPELGERPLHFLAQISCADLPADLWGGLGPREGCLLFFIDPNQGCPDGADALRVMHVPSRGPVRKAPEDLGPVHDGTYCGGSYRWLPADRVPSTWRRWPVDVVPFPNTLRHEDGRSHAAPADFAATLYDGAPVLPYRELKSIAPYTYGQALRAVNLLAARMRSEPREVANSYVRELLAEGDSVARLRATLGEQLAKALGVDSGSQNIGHIDRLRRCLTLVEASRSPDDLLARLEAERTRHARWREAVAEECDNLAGLLAAQPGETPLSIDDWHELQDCVKVRQWRGFELRIEYPGNQERYLDLVERTERASLEIPPGMTEEAMADWHDPATRDRIPVDRTDEIEAAARSLRSNRPHRMGGYHDGLQSDAVEGPAETVLLLQIASDDGMDWCWGDVGAYYFWIRPDDLARGDFSRVEMILECH